MRNNTRPDIRSLLVLPAKREIRVIMAPLTPDDDGPYSGYTPLQWTYEHLDCTCIDLAYGTDDLFAAVDDEGLYNKADEIDIVASIIVGYPAPLAGPALIQRRTSNGGTEGLRADTLQRAGNLVQLLGTVSDLGWKLINEQGKVLCG